MKAMIFAAGLGTRLKPFTDSHPKALAEVCGRPMLGIVIERLKSFGIDEIVVNVHHFADQIVDYLHDNNDFGVEIHISDETPKLLDTGGGILAARGWLDGNEPFIVHNADILTDIDLAVMLSVAKSVDALAALLVSLRTTRRYLLFDSQSMMLKGWTNVETDQFRPEGFKMSDTYRRLAFGGVHIIFPAIFPYLAAYAESKKEDCHTTGSIPKFSIMDFYIYNCSTLPIMGYQSPKPYRWHDIGKPDALEAAQRDFENDNF